MSSLKEVIGRISKPFCTGDFEWSINACSDETLNTDRYLYSPEFSFSDCSWYVKMYPKGNGSSHNEWISLYLGKKNSHSEKNVTFSFVMRYQDKECATSNFTHTFKKCRSTAGSERYVLRKNILDLIFLSVETKGRLSIKIRINQNFPSKEDILSEVKKQDIMCQDYKDLLLHDNKHDLILKVKDKEFKVHQSILQVRCPVFKSMFAHDMLEGNRGVVEILDCDPLAFEQFLFYIYTGNLETLDESVMLSLYYIADKYDMGHLKEVCCNFIKVSLSARNLCEVIRLALFHSDSSLLESANTYFAENAKEVFLTTEWISFLKENPIQANELLVKMVSYNKPEIIKLN